jgi:hypothetical protein
MTNETMTLGEALTVRADLQQRLGELRARVLAVAKVQEGEAPAEQPDVLLAEFEQTAERLRTLIARINRTNLTAVTADGDDAHRCARPPRRAGVPLQGAPRARGRGLGALGALLAA